MSLKLIAMQTPFNGLSFLRFVKETIALAVNKSLNMYCWGRTLTKTIIMNLNTENYKRKHKEKAILSFYSVHNVNILTGKNMKSGTRNGQHVSWPKKNTAKSGNQSAGFG